MKTRTSFRAAAAAITFCLASIITGCFSYHAIPDAIPKVEEAADTRFAGADVSITCIETKAEDQHIYSWSFGGGNFYANKRLWCEKLTLALSDEIGKRGAARTDKGKNVYSISIPEITGVPSNTSIGFNVKVAITSSAGWTKIYDGTASTFAGMLQPVPIVVDRAANLTLHDVLKKIVADRDFIKQVNARK